MIRNIKAALGLLCAGGLLLGCADERAAWLRQRQRQLDVELAKQSERAQSLSDERRHVAQLERELAERRKQLRRPSVDELSRLLADVRLERLRHREEGGALHLHLEGKGGGSNLVAALRALGRVERSVTLQRVAVAPKAWSADLLVPAEPAPARPAPAEPAPAEPAPSKVAPPPASAAGRLGVPPPLKPMPEPGIFEPSSNEQLQAEILHLEQRLGQIGKLLGEVDGLQQRKQRVEARLKLLEAFNPGERLEQQRATIEALFAGRKPRVTKAVAELAPGRITLRGLEPASEAKRLAALAGGGKVLQADKSVIVLALE